MVSPSDLAFTGQRSTAIAHVLLRSTRRRPSPVAHVDGSRWHLAYLSSRSRASRRPSTRCARSPGRCAWWTLSRKSAQGAGCFACPVLLAQPSIDGSSGPSASTFNGVALWPPRTPRCAAARELASRLFVQDSRLFVQICRLFVLRQLP